LEKAWKKLILLRRAKWLAQKWENKPLNCNQSIIFSKLIFKRWLFCLFKYCKDHISIHIERTEKHVVIVHRIGNFVKQRNVMKTSLKNKNRVLTLFIKHGKGGQFQIRKKQLNNYVLPGKLSGCLDFCKFKKRSNIRIYYFNGSCWIFYQTYTGVGHKNYSFETQ